MTQSPDIVTLLEQPYRHDLPAAQVRAALLTALAWPTSYWSDLAVGWIEHGAPVDMEVQIALAQVAMNSRFPQRLRHRAFALTRKRSKSNATGANVMTCQLSVEGSALWAGMADIELITPDGRHQIYLGFEGEPPHGDSYHSIWINNVRAPGYAWGCLFACTPDSRFLAMSWMEKLFERKTAVFDLEERRYFVLPFYLQSFRFRWPRLESTEIESDGRSYEFNGAEVWRASHSLVESQLLTTRAHLTSSSNSNSRRPTDSYGPDTAPPTEFDRTIGPVPTMRLLAPIAQRQAKLAKQKSGC